MSRRTWTSLLTLAVLLAVALVLARCGPGGPSTAGSVTTSPTASAVATSPTASAVATSPSAPSPAVASAPAGTPSSGTASVPAKALAVLRVVDDTGRSPQGYVGGREFLNDGRGGTAALPREDAAGGRVRYHEYDVNPRRSGVNRGPQRLVVGDDGSAFYTPDHYDSWIRIR